MYTLIAHPTPFRVGNLEKDLFTENIKASLRTVALRYLRARGGSTAAERRHISDRGIQLSTTDIFLPKTWKIQYYKVLYFVFIQNPWILDFSDVVLNSTTFYNFSAKNRRGGNQLSCRRRFWGPRVAGKLKENPL